MQLRLYRKIFVRCNAEKRSAWGINCARLRCSRAPFIPRLGIFDISTDTVKSSRACHVRIANLRERRSRLAHPKKDERTTTTMIRIPRSASSHAAFCPIQLVVYAVVICATIRYDLHLFGRLIDPKEVLASLSPRGQRWIIE